MLDVPLREFTRVGGGDRRITINLRYLISVEPGPGPDQTVLRITTGRGFEEYTIRGGYDEVTAALQDTAATD